MPLQSRSTVELQQFKGLEKYNPSHLGARQDYASSLQVRSGLPRVEDKKRKGAVTCPPCLLSPPKISSGCICGLAQGRRAQPLAQMGLSNQWQLTGTVLSKVQLYPGQIRGLQHLVSGSDWSNWWCWCHFSLLNPKEFHDGETQLHCPRSMALP